MPSAGAPPGTRPDAAAKRAATWKGIRLSVVGGILMGMFYPLVEIGKTGEKGLGPYAVGFVFGLGVLASVFVYNLYFMRFPIEGPRLSFGDYLRGNWWVHFLGIVGGVMWMAGSLSNFVAASAPRELQVGPAISYAIGQGSTMVGALWGVLVWREFAGGGARVNRLLVLMFVALSDRPGGGFHRAALCRPLVLRPREHIPFPWGGTTSRGRLPPPGAPASGLRILERNWPPPPL